MVCPENHTNYYLFNVNCTSFNKIYCLGSAIWKFSTSSRDKLPVQEIAIRFDKFHLITNLCCKIYLSWKINKILFSFVKASHYQRRKHRVMLCATPRGIHQQIFGASCMLQLIHCCTKPSMKRMKQVLLMTTKFSLFSFLNNTNTIICIAHWSPMMQRRLLGVNLGVNWPPCRPLNDARPLATHSVTNERSQTGNWSFQVELFKVSYLTDNAAYFFEKLHMFSFSYVVFRWISILA